jgi:hypothetical protein
VVTRRSRKGTGESDPRARSNTEGPNGTAPRVRLIHGLKRTKERRRRRVTTPHFQPGTGRPPGGTETNPKMAGDGRTAPPARRLCDGAGDEQPVGVVGGSGGDLLEVRLLIKPPTFRTPPHCHGTEAWSPAGAERGQANLIRVLEATLKGPTARLPASD